MFGKHRRPGDAAIIGTLRTEINRLVLALSRAGVIDPQTGEERSAVEILRDAQYWKGVAMALGHRVDDLEKERDELAAKLFPLPVYLDPASLLTKPDACQECGTVPVVYVNADGFRLCSACCEGCSSECREQHTYEGGCALARDTHTPRPYERVSRIVQDAQKPSQDNGDRYYCPTSGDVESATHGGFQTCCNRADLHRPVTVHGDGISEHEWSPLGFCRLCPARKDDPVTVPIPLVKPLWEKHSGVCVCGHLWDQHRSSDSLHSDKVICVGCQGAGLTTLACRTFSAKEKQS